MKAKFTYTDIRVRNLERLVSCTRGAWDDGEATNGVVSLVDETDGLVLGANYHGKGSPYRTRFIVGESLDHPAFQVPSLDAALPEAKEAGCPMRPVVKAEKSRWALIRAPDRIWISLFQ
ncbi:MAG: hypothetical protein HYZ12_01060 [Thaumarchaeota archaeon]|nr:hypothetical protein [Nitrososphaerota archaeon]